MSHQAFWDAIHAAKVRSGGGGAGLAPVMPPATILRMFTNMRIVAVHEHERGVVLEVGPVGHMSRRQVFIEGVTSVRDITFDRQTWAQADDEQAQIDIGDDIYEREREDREP